MIAQAVESVLLQMTKEQFSYEVVVVDDGSTDNTGEVVQQLIASVGERLRYEPKPGGGVADARNFGVRKARGALVAFWDDDQIADPNWLSELYKTAQEKNVKCVGGSLSLLLPDDITLELGPKARRVLGARSMGNESKKYPAGDVPGTGNVLFYKELFLELNGFDTNMREGAEDTDFFTRLQQRGYEIWYAPNAHGLHVIPAERATENFIRWVTTKSGVAWARIQYKRKGLAQLLLTSFTRMVLAFVRDIPLQIWSQLSRNQALQMDCLCTSSFTTGYIRGSLYFLSPKLFKQQNFMEFVDFRRHGGERSN